ncbi:aminoacyl-tRNA hydrolase [bacterium]|nr:aminoacyl-tRNA hydrolase [bacterium]
MDAKQVIIVRKDLKMRPGKIAAQSCHASMKAILDRCSLLEGRVLFMSNMPEPMYQWLTGIFTKVVLAVDSEEDLLELYNKALALDLPCSLITDAGLTVFNGVPTNTCIAIGPEESYKIDAITNHLKLL